MNLSTFPRSSAHKGTIHHVAKDLCMFEADGITSDSGLRDTLLWVGGLGDTLMSVKYPMKLRAYLPSGWRIMVAVLGSSGRSWGIGSIGRDASDLGKLVRYIRAGQAGGKIVLMGHSTGCQDCMEYVVGRDSALRDPVDGVILQAPVSDREAIEDGVDEKILHAINTMAIHMCNAGCGEDALPRRLTGQIFGRVAISARRWIDIASPGPEHAGADDYFSSDLSTARLETTFGKFPATTPLCILHMGADPSVPAFVDKQGLIERWTRIVESAGGIVDRKASGIVKGASHNLNNDPDWVVKDLASRVGDFVARIDNGSLFRLDTSHPPT